MRPEDLTAEEVIVIGDAIDYTLRHVRGPDREELAQDLWVALLAELRTYDRRRSALTTWSSVIAQYRLCDLWRRRHGSRRPQKTPPHPQPLPEDYREAPSVVDPGPGPLARAIEREELARRVRRLARSRRERLALTLLVAGLSQETAARAVGLCPSRVSQIVGEFRARLEGTGDD